jgi:hypothetical protein
MFSQMPFMQLHQWAMHALLKIKKTQQQGKTCHAA